MKQSKQLTDRSDTRSLRAGELKLVHLTAEHDGI